MIIENHLPFYHLLFTVYFLPFTLFPLPFRNIFHFFFEILQPTKKNAVNRITENKNE